MRLFVAINLPAPVRRAVVEATAPLRAAAPDVAWVDEARVHLTVKFLGEQSEAAADAAAEALRAAAARHEVMQVVVGGVGAFPNFRRARVVWMGVEPSPRLELLHHDIEDACAALGYEVDGRPFRPHLTLGRLRDRAPEGVLRELARAARAVRYRTRVDVASVDLMRSELARGGSRYSVVAAAPLRGH